MSTFQQIESQNNVPLLRQRFSAPRTRELKGHHKAVRCVTFTSDGTLLSGSTDNSIRVWTNIDRVAASSTISVSRELAGHTDTVDQICFNPREPQSIASTSADRTLKLWDLRSYRESASVSAEGDVINIAWSPDGHHIITGTKDNVVTVIDARTQKIAKKRKYRVEVNEMRWDRDGKLFFLTTGDGTIEIFNWSVKGQATYVDDQQASQNTSHISTVHAHAANIVALEFDTNGKYFAAGALDSTASIWSLPEMICVRTLSAGEAKEMRGLCFSHDSEMLAFTTKDSIEIMHVPTGENIFSRSARNLNSVSFHPKQHWFAYALEDKDITLLIPDQK